MTRKHDLPPRWDGCTVIWDEWSPPFRFHCVPPYQCPTCGSRRDPIQAGGLVAHRPDATLEELALSIATPQTVGYRSLTVYRCLGCGHDQVLDGFGDDATWWDLGAEDYTDTGSDHPSGHHVDDRSHPVTRQRYTTTSEYAELADAEADALTRPCPHTGKDAFGKPVSCGAQVGEQCNNPRNGKPYRAPLIHPERRQPSAR